MKLARYVVILMVTPVFAAINSYGADTLDLKTGTLTVTVDTAFPRIIQYRHKNGATLDGQKSPVSIVHFNGKEEPCNIKLASSTKDSATYSLNFQEKKVVITVKITVGNEAVTIALTGVKESGSAKLMRMAFPGNVLLSLDDSSPEAEVGAVGIWVSNDRYYHNIAGASRKLVHHESLSKLSDAKNVQHKLNYFFLADGKLAAGIAGNHYESFNRAEYAITKQDGRTVCKAWAPQWAYREIETETAEMPYTKIFITADCNSDGKATWQDGAIAYRRNMPKPFGCKYVKTTVGSSIAMNFASGAQQPFLKILDVVKKIHRATDGLGNEILIKGFASEGHDSANTDFSGHYNERAGGVKDFNVLLDNAEKYNSRIGIHANITEIYPEAHQYDHKILFKDDKGKLRRRWVWLDTSVEIDRMKYVLTGSLFKSMEGMKKEIPGLDFVYLDKCHQADWSTMKIFTKLHSLGLPTYAEGNDSPDIYTTWAHWRGDNLGPVLTFLWYADRDIFTDDQILRDGRDDNEGFMGWQSKHNFNNFIRQVFFQHLPSKYLKNFELLRWEPGKSAHFSNGVKSARQPNGWVHVTRNDRLIMGWAGLTGRYMTIFVPWDPIKENKIYVWDSEGRQRQWTLPDSWKSLKSVYLYKLTDQGRCEEKSLPVTDGKVSLSVPKNTPYVIYKTKAPKQMEYNWGQGSLVKEPGFDSYGFSTWKKKAENGDTSHIAIHNDGVRNAYLVISGKNGASSEVSQVMTGLKPGKSYVAAAWVLVDGERTASIEIQPLGKEEIKPISNYVKLTNVKHGLACDQRKGTRYQYMKVFFTMPMGCKDARISLKASKTPGKGSVYFDDVRVVERKPSPEESKHWIWEDFEDTSLGGYGILTCNFGERTHLSETNSPHTKDTINGRFSFKSRDKGRVGRTLPCNVRFKPLTKYRLSMETLGGSGSVRVISEGKTVLNKGFSGRSKVSGEFVTGNDTESFLEIHRGGGDYTVVDDIAIDEIGPAGK